MQWGLSLPKPAMLLYYFAKLIGLAPFTVKRNEIYPPKLLDILYPLSLAVTYLLFTVMIFNPIITNPAGNYHFNFAKVLITIHHFMNILSVIFTVIIFLLMRKKAVYLMNKLCVVSSDLKSLGIEEDHEKMFKNSLVTTVTANGVLVATYVILSFLESNWPMYFTIKYGMESWFLLNVILIFVQMLLCIRQRFALVNHKLSDSFLPTDHVASLNDLHMCLGGRKLSGDGLTDLQRILKIEALHLELCDLVDRTSSLFAAPIISISLQFFTELILCVYWVYFIVHNTVLSPIYEIFCALIKMAILIVNLFTIVYASATTRQVGNATRVVLSKVWDKSTPQDLKDEFFLFSLQLLHGRITVSAFGFFNLDYSYLCKVFCAVVAYVIIIIQFDTL